MISELPNCIFKGARSLQANDINAKRLEFSRHLKRLSTMRVIWRYGISPPIIFEVVSFLLLIVTAYILHGIAYNYFISCCSPKL